MIDLTNEPLPACPERQRHSHKGDYGKALVIGGSRDMAGAPALAGKACLRSGAGVVCVVTPKCVQPTVASFCPEYLTRGWQDDGSGFTKDSGAALVHNCGEADAVAFGPGAGRSAATATLVMQAWVVPPTPLVVDADGLAGLSLAVGSLEPAGPRIVTPHAGEFAMLSGEALADPDDDAERIERAADLANRLGADRNGDVRSVVLLKGPRTVVTDGERYAINTTGNPGMATGGSGDVLTGVITALVAGGLSTFDAARLGAYAHGLAGDLAAAKLGEQALMAGDLIDFLPAAWLALA